MVRVDPMMFLLALIVGWAFGAFIEWRKGKLASGDAHRVEQRGSL